MLRRVENITAVGNFAGTTATSRHDFEEVTLIYGENGRGKSTLTSLFASLSSNDPRRILERKTLGQTTSPSVTISATNGDEFVFDNNSWNRAHPDILVFDNHFVEENVHSGREVTSDQRKNLLTFALGSRAVTQQKIERKVSDDLDSQKRATRLLEASLEGHRGKMPLESFAALKKLPDFDGPLRELHQQLDAARSSQIILRQPVPALVPDYPLDLEALLGTLDVTLDDIHTQSLEALHAEIRSSEARVPQDWLAAGQRFDDGETCPYCRQDTRDVEIISAYRALFDESYQTLRSTLLKAQTDLSNGATASYAAVIQGSLSTSQEVLRTWESCGALLNGRAPTSTEALIDDLESVRSCLLEAIESKISNLALRTVDLLSVAELRRRCANIISIITQKNDEMRASIEAITSFKAGLAGANVQAIEAEIGNVQMAQLRHSPDVAPILDELQKSRNEEDRLLSLRDTARDELRDRMNETLDEFQNRINVQLKKQDASFSIDKLKGNYAGGSPRTQYGIRLRDEVIPLTTSVNGFRTALSEGDKRTMAFAFFIASALADANLDRKIIVIDDPVTSLDRNRREQTLMTLRTLTERSQQIILLAHDANFLIDARSDLSRIRRHGAGNNVSVACLSIQLTAGRNSDFGHCDLDKLCESQFMRRHRLLTEFVADPTRDASAAEEAIRPVMEGYLHRRFPGKIGANQMLGKAISEIECSLKKGSTNFTSIAALLPEIREISKFAGESHHDTHPDRQKPRATEATILHYAERALAVVSGA